MHMHMHMPTHVIYESRRSTPVHQLRLRPCIDWFRTWATIMADNSGAASLSSPAESLRNTCRGGSSLLLGSPQRLYTTQSKGSLEGRLKMNLYSLGVREAGVAYDSEGESPYNPC